MAIQSGTATSGRGSWNKRPVVKRRRRRNRRSSGCQLAVRQPLLRLLRLLRLYLAVRWSTSVAGAFEEGRKENEHGRRKRGREYPEASPLLERQTGRFRK